ncbi:MAG TPA: AarF/UbiB family protein [Pyrinomonadaceae bacterium]|nr:AarF/UbiB family protein [Pyrinomonadaceae bacterium]
MTLSLKPESLKRYKDIIALLIKYGRSDLVKQASLVKMGGNHTSALATTVAPKAEELASDLESLGATFIKLGQLLSTRGDMLPEPYLDALSRLQDQVEPFPYEEVEQIVSSELGVRISKAFAEFDREPEAAASLAQVHRAYLRDGRAVVVKIQRPGVRDQVVNDLDALEEVAGFIDAHTEVGKRYEFGNLLAELRRSLLRELDFQREASNLIRLGENLREFDRLIVPVPIEDFTTSRVLTMEYVAGKNISNLSPLRLLELEGTDLADELFRAYLKQILIDGFFHADPHPGNVFLTYDNRIALLDLGMVSHINETFQEKLLQLLLAISEGRGDEAAEISIRMGEPKSNFDKSDYKHRVASLVARQADTSLERIDAGHVVLEITRISADCWFRMAPEFTMIAKTLLDLDRVVYTLAPDFDPNAIIRQEATNILTQRIVKSIRPGGILSSVVEVKEFVGKFPARVNKILDVVGNNEMKISVDAIDERVVLDGLQKVANRITLGLILAALIVGAALMMRVETSFRILGYPGLPTIFFLLAAMAGVVLVFSIVFYDVKPKKKDGED